MTETALHNRLFSILFTGIFCFGFCNAQPLKKDTIFNKPATIEEVVVTATRTQKSIGNIPVPIQVISKKFIQQTGSQKLIDILQQQTGLVLADNPLGQALQGYPNPFGSGIQLQGLDPAYTLILLDGEPLTGRNAGILNLGRVAVGNIQQIEIVKGPATSLYGSDALAGVINIITETPKSSTGGLQLHHATNNTWGFTGNGFYKKNKMAVQIFANRSSSNGYDLDETIYGKTADPYHNYSFAAKIYYDINKHSQFQSSVRLFTQKQFNNYLVFSGTQPEPVEGTSVEKDWSVNNQLSYKISKKIKLTGRFYITGYKNNADVFLQSSKKLFDNSFMQQFLIKPEIVLEAGEKNNKKLIAGAGYNYEKIDANRYSTSHNFNAFYLFTQKEWLINNNRINITAGGRLDKHTLYNFQFNPKLALGYKLFNALTINASVGTGFKAPDFRQQFLNFTNSLIGYTLLGSNELYTGLLQLKQQGQIDSSVNVNPYINTPSLQPEKSVGINIGARYRVNSSTIINTNFFRNDITNLIERYNLPFTKINNQAIFSYANINKVFTSGFDVNINYQVNKRLGLNGGYQYLQAKDKDIINKIKQQQLVKRDPVTYVSTYVGLKDYGGLFNRSKHAANLQANYTTLNKITASFRGVYRGRFGFSDLNGNAILDDNREFVNGYLLLNASVSKLFNRGIEVQAGSDNLLNFTDKDKLPNLFGRTYFINCNINLQQLFNLKTQTSHQ